MLYIDRSYEPIDIARSIARHGYFESEPLIGVREAGNITIVEGNRRLVALRGLLDLAARAKLAEQTKAWTRIPAPDALADRVPADFPVVVVTNRDEIAPLLGYRHISGIAPWEPIAQARYIWHLVDESGYSFEDVAEVVGRDLTEIRSMYRDYEIVRQAKETFGLDTKTVEANFGVFNRAMTTQNLRAYISAPAPAKVSTETWPLPDNAKPALRQLFAWVFGDRTNEPVINDSRQLNALGKVVVDPVGLAELRSTKNLEAATEAIGDPGDRFNRQLARARDRLRQAATLKPATMTAESRALLDECSTALAELQRGSRGGRSR